MNDVASDGFDPLRSPDTRKSNNVRQLMGKQSNPAGTGKHLKIAIGGSLQINHLKRATGKD
ncbi:hypothetical protein [Xanthomonas euroxanthea]|uniref:hypothetical protein n=1 Tax=Xanthomonas euroxanthea TaxID=2259622 RepID=UPI00193401A2|nr:hypothetical protein [Xanthomonas euroxanthea]CAE1136372.1 hypothetical protein XTG_002206 [Xanthomonas euroxanthea]